MVITFLTIGIAQAQIITSKSIFGEVYSSEFVADAPVDVIVKRLGNADSMAKIMDFVNKGGFRRGSQRPETRRSSYLFTALKRTGITGYSC